MVKTRRDATRRDATAERNGIEREKQHVRDWFAPTFFMISYENLMLCVIAAVAAAATKNKKQCDDDLFEAEKHGHISC